MPVTININNLTLCHKGSDGISMATIPDVCKTPSPPGSPVPIPYPNIAMSSDLMKGTTTVKADGGNMCANHGSEFFKSTGDEPGVAGGVASSTVMKEATWITFSFDVKLEGKAACRLTDKMFHNHQNTVNLGGELQPPLPANDLESKLLQCDEAKAVYDKAKQANGGRNPIIITGTSGSGMGGHTEKGAGKIIISDKNEGCQQVQTLCFELGNLSRKQEFAKAKQAITTASRRDFIRGYERIEYDTAIDTQRVVEACLESWGCEKSKSRYEWVMDAKDFDDCYENYLSDEHIEHYGKLWDAANKPSGAAKGAAKGALAGAIIGAAVGGPVGAAVGVGLGATVGYLW
jgi:hypothetical protein